MRISVAARFAAVAAAVLFAACGGGGGSSSAPPPGFVTTTFTPAPTSTPVPTASPTPTPTASPTPSLVKAVPAALSFETTGPATGTTVTITEPNYAGTFVESDTCAPSGGAVIATVTPTTAATQFSVTAENAGTCVLTFTDAHGNTAHVPVSVTLTTLTGQFVKRR
jgi:hypothetical protein